MFSADDKKPQGCYTSGQGFFSCSTQLTLVNVYVDLVVFTRIAGTLKTGSGRYWR